MTAFLDIRGLTLGYSRTDVVKGIDIAVPRGAVVSLLGANGAGKTTTLKGLSGLIKVRRGTVRLDGADLVGQAPHRIARAGIAHVPEGRQIFANLTVLENLRMGAFLVTAKAEIARRREAVMAHFPRLAERLDQAAGFLSGGEQQMLAMGRALMADPKVLLLDEPSMGLAPLFVEEIFTMIRTLKAEGRTILLVEQNAQAALQVSDHAYVLESGSIKLSGPAAEVATNPEVIAAYLGGG